VTWGIPPTNRSLLADAVDLRRRLRRVPPIRPCRAPVHHRPTPGLTCGCAGLALYGPAILHAYHARTGRTLLLNTSLNLDGHPIAGTATRAMEVLLRSDLAYLQLGPCLVSKGAQTC